MAGHSNGRGVECLRLEATHVDLMPNGLWVWWAASLADAHAAVGAGVVRPRISCESRC